MALKPLASLPETPLNINRALLSVSDKTDIVPLAEVLAAQGVVLISTGGTANVLKDAGLPVTDASEVTGFPECLDGRVKTLHPHIHGGILARTSHEADNRELADLNIQPIELVVVNLYPFKEILTDGDPGPAKATEFIDIGGPTMVRAAAKNYAHVCILTSPEQYSDFLDQFSAGDGITYQSRLTFAREAFGHTADYDSAISNYFSGLLKEQPARSLQVSLPLSQELRYGENPHQLAAVYGDQESFIDCFHGKQLSYNNYLDVDAALSLMAGFEDADPTCAIFKHTIPCGVATASTLKQAYEQAFNTDSVSPFGGIIMVNTELDLITAQAIDTIFTEIIIAPSYSAEALELLIEKKNRRLIRLKKYPGAGGTQPFRSIFGGALSQQADLGVTDPGTFRVVTKREPTETEMADLLFAWQVVRHVKSNAIVYAKNRATLGIGSGQTSRVDSSEIAVAKALKEGLSLQGSVISSDAFFPFADGVEAAAKAGATAVIQPGGSVRDEEVIAEANKYGMAMVFTGMRHFKH